MPQGNAPHVRIADHIRFQTIYVNLCVENDRKVADLLPAFNVFTESFHNGRSVTRHTAEMWVGGIFTGFNLCRVRRLGAIASLFRKNLYLLKAPQRIAEQSPWLRALI